jgi:ubiquinone/menaquinone biosynthesis C-methylase UbiE
MSAMSVDHYAGAARRWAEGASLVYRPIAYELVRTSPHPLAGRVVLDVGAGTGVASTTLVEVGAVPVAADLSHGMLAWQAGDRPPAVVADIRALPFADRAVDDTVAAFVLNHLDDPAAGIAELVRVTRPGGALLACVYSNASRSEVRDAIDEAAQREGWQVPRWYRDIKQKAAPVLGTAAAMERAAQQAGLVDVIVEESPVDVGVTEPEQLVKYRLGQAHYTAWFDQLEPGRAEQIHARLAEEIRPIMRPYRPIVVFLTALTP